MSDPLAEDGAAAATVDHFLGGKLVLAQPARGHGYRVNIDAFLLAEFASPRSKRLRIWDLGAGVGPVGLTLARHGAANVVLVERAGQVAALAERNVEANGLRDFVSVQARDVLAAAEQSPGAADLVVSNPPYFRPGSTRPSPTSDVADARSGDATRFIQAARRLLSTRGRACFIYPAADVVTFLADLRAVGLEPKRIQFVHAKAAAAARVFMVEAQAAKRGGLVVAPPLFEDALPPLR